MRRAFSIVHPVVALATVLASWGCADDPPPRRKEDVSVVRIDVKGPSGPLWVGAIIELEAVVHLSDGRVAEAPAIEWSSSDPGVATVDDRGRVTGVAPGEARVFAASGGVRGDWRVEVIPAPLARIEIEPSMVELYVGASTTLVAKGFDSNGQSVEDLDVEWSSSDPERATVDEGGTVRALGTGQVSILARSGGFTAEATVTIVPTPVARVAIEPPSITLFDGETVVLEAKVYGPNDEAIEDRTVVWSVEDPSIATIDQKGSLTAIIPGTTRVRAHVEERSASAPVEVRPTPVASVEIEPFAGPLYVGESVRLQARALAADGRELAGRSIVWASSDEAVATVEGAGLVRGRAPGAVEITATAEGIADSIAFEVWMPVDRIEVSPPSHRMFKSDSVQLEARLLDANGELLQGRPVTWRSSNPTVATVDESGLVHALTPGTTQIVAEAEGVRAEAGVEVVTVRFDTISTGIATTCGISAPDEHAYCWGVWLDGTPSTAELERFPRPLSESMTFEEVSVGTRHVCARTAAGEVWCQGLNARGELGNGTTTPSDTLVQVQSPVAFQSIAAGTFYTCGIATDGSAYCWGWNGRGALGDGTTLDSAVPVAVAGGHTFHRIVASVGDATGTVSATTCGITTSGELYCWGDGMAGQLGDGVAHEVSAPVRGASTLALADVRVASYDHNPELPSYLGFACSLNFGGAIHCWGSNDRGQLGDGTRTDSLLPVLASSTTTFSQIAVTGGANGNAHACALAGDGSIWCWGSNSAGQLGIGTRGGEELEPVQVGATGVQFVDVQVGAEYSCGLTGQGLVYCWGGIGSTWPVAIGGLQPTLPAWQ